MAYNLKTAAADVSETALEQTFSDLANAKLRDAAPSLLDYLVGFQMVRHEDDGSKAVGIFGFEIGDQYIYAPVFFKNGEIRGLDSLYNPDSDLFCPLTEDFVNEIINRRPNQLGEVNRESDSERGTKNPNYYRLRQIPSGAGTNLGGDSGLLSKHGEAKFIGAAGLTQSGALTMLAMMEKCASAMDRSCEESLDLPTALKMFPKVGNAFLEDMKSNAKMASLVQEFYSVLDFSFPEVVKTAASDGDDVLVVSEVGQPGADKLTDEQKKKIIDGGTAVIDRRPELKKSKVYRTEVKQMMTSATAGGMYDVLMADGSISEFLIFKIAGSEDMMAYELESGKVCIIASQYLVTLHQYEPAQFREKLETEAIDVEKVKSGDAVAFVCQNGECSIPFVIERSVSDGDTKVLKTAGRYYLPLGSGLCSGMKMWSDGPVDRMNSARTVWRHRDIADRIDDIVISEAGSGQIRYYEDRMAINSKKFRALILNTKKSGDSWGWTRDDATFSKSDFGTTDTLHKSMEKISEPLKIWAEERYLVIRDFTDHTETLNKTAALEHLILKHGCTEEDAVGMIAEATRIPQTWRIKYAAHLLDVADPQDEGESGPMSSYHPTQFKTHVIDKAHSDDNRPFYMYNSPFAGNDDQQGDGDDASPSKTKNVVEDAAETGQKEVFDAAVLGSLVKTHSPCDMVERFMPTIVAGMDRLGRILFLLNWHSDEFKDRYGEKDLSELGDNLKSTFEALGDLVLFLKKKTLSGDPDHFGLGLSSTVDG